jgi:hypothetical protein
MSPSMTSMMMGSHASQDISFDISRNTLSSAPCEAPDSPGRPD